MKVFKFALVMMVWVAAGMAQGNSFGSHGMFLFGEQSTYASHLPMFHKPHDFQVLLEIELKGEADVLDAKGFRTLFPEELELEKIMDGSVTSFSATLFSGHFERGGIALGEVQVLVKEVLYKQKLQADQELGSSFIVFGDNGEYYAAHQILGAPSYDAILKVSAPYVLEFPPCFRRLCTDPVRTAFAFDESVLKLKSSLDFAARAPQPGEAIGSYLSVNAEVIDVLYLEYNELAH